MNLCPIEGTSDFFPAFFFWFYELIKYMKHYNICDPRVVFQNLLFYL